MLVPARFVSHVGCRLRSRGLPAPRVDGFDRLCRVFSAKVNRCSQDGGVPATGKRGRERARVAGSGRGVLIGPVRVTEPGNSWRLGDHGGLWILTVFPPVRGGG